MNHGEGWVDTEKFPVRVVGMSIVTGRGDEGVTDLLFGKRVAKTSLRVGVLGVVDELNAALGWARAAGLSEEVEGLVDRLQEQLVGVMGMVACLAEDEGRYREKGYAWVGEEEVVWVEKVAKEFEARGVRFQGWARPGVEHSLGRAGLDVARTVARRAEREVWLLHESGEVVSEPVRRYFNRISDLLWILARVA